MEAATRPLAEGSTFRGLEGITFLLRDENGFVYRARHTALARTMLLRILPVGPSPDSALVERFLERARRLSALDDPHVAQVYDFGREGDLLYLCMEGGDDPPAPATGHRVPVEPRLTLPMLRDISLGLAALHAQGIAHGGITRTAVQVGSEGGARLSDFPLIPHGTDAGAPSRDLSDLEGLLRMEISGKDTPEIRKGAAAAAAAIDRLHRKRRRIRLALPGAVLGLLVTATVLMMALPGSRGDSRENLLDRIDLERDAIYGSWRFEGAALCCPREGGGPARVQVPGPMPEEYDVVLEGLRLYPPEANAPPGEVAIGLLFGGRQASVHLDMQPRKGFKSGLGLIAERPPYENESTYFGRVLSTDRPHHIVCSVRRGALRVRVDGRTIIDWQGDFQSLSFHPVRWVRRKDALMFGVSRARCRLEALYLVPFASGEEPSR